MTAPSEEMIEAALAAHAGCGGKTWPDDFKNAKDRGQLRHKAREMLEAALAVARPDQLPAHHPVTCGTAYLTAERTLRIVERMAQHGPMTIDDIEAISTLSSEAGVAFARIALQHQPSDNENIPF